MISSGSPLERDQYGFLFADPCMTPIPQHLRPEAGVRSPRAGPHVAESAGSRARWRRRPSSVAPLNASESWDTHRLFRSHRSPRGRWDGRGLSSARPARARRRRVARGARLPHNDAAALRLEHPIHPSAPVPDRCVLLASPGSSRRALRWPRARPRRRSSSAGHAAGVRRAGERRALTPRSSCPGRRVRPGRRGAQRGRAPCPRHQTEPRRGPCGARSRFAAG